MAIFCRHDGSPLRHASIAKFYLHICFHGDKFYGLTKDAIKSTSPFQCNVEAFRASINWYFAYIEGLMIERAIWFTRNFTNTGRSANTKVTLLPGNFLVSSFATKAPLLPPAAYILFPRDKRRDTLSIWYRRLPYALQEFLGDADYAMMLFDSPASYCQSHSTRSRWCTPRHAVL